jgi:hypothetical protein
MTWYHLNWLSLDSRPASSGFHFHKTNEPDQQITFWPLGHQCHSQSLSVLLGPGLLLDSYSHGESF